jgi:hypothetical protein
MSSGVSARQAHGAVNLDRAIDHIVQHLNAPTTLTIAISKRASWPASSLRAASRVSSRLAWICAALSNT